MRSPIATMALALAFGTAVLGQQPITNPPRTLSPTPPSAAVPPGGATTPGSDKPQVVANGAELPKPGEVAADPNAHLPTEPIDPYLLTKDVGPFMVLAYTFRMPNAAKYAQALAMELRSDGYPAWVFYIKIHPGNSNIYNVPPTSHPADRAGHVAAPERYRTFDEAAVLVGNCKTEADAKALLPKIKHLHPKCLPEASGIFQGLRKPGLSKAMMTANPLIPAQLMYPGRPIPAGGGGRVFDPSLAVANFDRLKKRDPQVVQWNQGPHSIYNCPGAYTLPVATFTGRATFNPTQMQMMMPEKKAVANSPLATAADDAEAFAASLSKSKTLQQAGMKAYVYHDRSSSRVTIGSFNDMNDPAIANVKGMWTLVLRDLWFNAKDSRRESEFVPAPSPTVIAVPRA
jgi:hypothetical protein